MDRNSIIGMILIFGILVVFSIINQPSKEEIEAAKSRRDSIAQVEQQKEIALSEKQQNEVVNESANDNIATLPDSLQEDVSKQNYERYGAFAVAATGTEKFYTLENNLVKITFSNKGGKIYSVELKNYQTHDSLPLILFDGPKNVFSLNFFAQNRNIKTDQFYFQTESPEKVVVNGPVVKKGQESKIKFNNANPGETKSVKFRLELDNGKYTEFIYSLPYNTYMVDFDVNMSGMNEYIATNQSYLNFNWAVDMHRQEKPSRYGEDRYTNISYKFYEDEVDNLKQSGDDEEDLTTRVKWISFKQLFFNSTIISKESFPNAFIRSHQYKDDKKYLARFFTDIAFPYNGAPSENLNMNFYFGPNHYQTLKQYDIKLERLVYIGYPVIRSVNKYIIIPFFNFLRKYISNFGIIILILTVVIKMVLFPFTYKSYQSQAKMRVLKPEIDELTKKYPKEKAMERQQATMDLYKKAGVNPMGGCLPMLLQMPILFAMFFFFPTSIELRQESFLWAHDLSTYDSILDLPFTIPFYGDHVSLFCLLMTITTIINTKLTQQSASNNAMPGMQTMMYIMPIFFLFLLNNYSSGLSYYYFLANVITIGQTFFIRGIIDEDKLHAKLQANKKKPVKKSKFQQRMEKMAKERGVQMPKK